MVNLADFIFGRLYEERDSWVDRSPQDRLAQAQRVLLDGLDKGYSVRDVICYTDDIVPWNYDPSDSPIVIKYWIPLLDWLLADLKDGDLTEPNRHHPNLNSAFRTDLLPERK